MTPDNELTVILHDINTLVHFDSQMNDDFK